MRYSVVFGFGNQQYLLFHKGIQSKNNLTKKNSIARNSAAGISLNALHFILNKTLVTVGLIH